MTIYKHTCKDVPKSVWVIFYLSCPISTHSQYHTQPLAHCSSKSGEWVTGKQWAKLINVRCIFVEAHLSYHRGASIVGEGAYPVRMSGPQGEGGRVDILTSSCLGHQRLGPRELSCRLWCPVLVVVVCSPLQIEWTKCHNNWSPICRSEILVDDVFCLAEQN